VAVQVIPPVPKTTTTTTTTFRPPATTQRIVAIFPEYDASAVSGTSPVLPGPRGEDGYPGDRGRPGNVNINFVKMINEI